MTQHYRVGEIMVAEGVITALQTLVSREVDPLHPSVVTIGSVHAGTAPNVIAETARLEASIRPMARAFSELRNARLEVRIDPGYPPVVNTPRESQLAWRAAAAVVGGRGMRYELFGLTAGELGSEFDLDRMLGHGYLPRIYQASRPKRMLDASIADHLKEEVAAEGLVRNIPAFSDVLDVAALRDGEIVNFSTIARECGVSSHTVKNHFQILEDTLIGRWLPAYRKRPKRRVIGAPKFTFADVGVVNRLARRGDPQPGSELFGKALKNWVFHELSALASYQAMDDRLTYWRLASGIEILPATTFARRL